MIKLENGDILYFCNKVIKSPNNLTYKNQLYLALGHFIFDAEICKMMQEEKKYNIKDLFDEK